MLDDFRELACTAAARRTVAPGGATRVTPPRSQRFVEACRTGASPGRSSDMAAVMRATFAIRDAVRGGRRPAA